MRFHTFPNVAFPSIEAFLLSPPERSLIGRVNGAGDSGNIS